MFKSVFSKFLTAFILIITICFSMLLLVVYSIVNHYAATVQLESARHTAEAVRDFLIDEMEGDDFSADGVDQNIDRMLRLAATNTDQMLIILTDEKGEPLGMQSNYSDRLPKDFSIPLEVLTVLSRGEAVSGASHFRSMIEDSRLAYAVPLMEDDALRGAVVISSPSERWTGFLNVMARTIVMASLWIMLAALIAVYFISERVSAPLREMRHAAKDFAGGNFDRRVVVQGQDEVAELGIAFNQMAQSLQTLETARSSFVANVSHDLRSPMTTISGFIDAIRDGVIPPEKQDYYLGVISGEVHRLSRLVSSLLDVTRIEAGERKFVMTSFDICEMGRQILLSFEQQIEAKQIVVEFVCDEDSMIALADHDAIYQIFYNICDNAVKFCREEGILRISIRRAANAGKDKKNRLQVSVYNQGQGIANEDLPMVFDRFYKGDKSRGLDRRGTGLGLYIAKTIITAHGEDIWVTSVEGRDCQFTFTLKEPSSHT